ncbi:MAG: C10 family peptidase [Candidatus Cloacimonetes bacterium]|nr:C10 family peptidase [Candidatus Cloacimonadota bacterium]MCF7813056.1 C10 family peptidase [Candidatus Cloacimonadota bacterium]MCF7867203.1 C10 family peptidase [Candidatus Cloacimonadota bacterium]MCF7882647.1 C10 family peptidase [Candidatus Cloacimonadota bacterium]
MKKFVIAFVITLLLGSMFAVRIDEDSALQTATQHLRAWDETSRNIESTHYMLDDDDTMLAYVYDLEPEGFIIVSTDTDIKPVVGYSFRNDFTVEDKDRNVGYLFVEADMRSRLAAIPYTNPDIIQANNDLWQQYQNGSISFANSRDTVWPPAGYSATEGWVETEWDQSPSPYNTMCPIDPQNGGRSVTGCVATVIAQILHYHRYIGSVSFNDNDDYYSSYTSPAIHIDDDHVALSFPSFPELNDHLTDAMIAYQLGYPITNDMIAAINFASGIAVQMGYSSNASGAYSSDVHTAFLNKFGYDTATYVGYTNAAFYNDLKIDMMEARPVYFGILSNGGSGHAIICDGWNEDTDYFHLNMGWGGYQNGWYDIPLNMPSGYNQIHSAIRNIEGGTVPFEMTGMVFANNAPLDQTFLTLEGPRYYEFDIDDPNGYFGTDYMHAGTYVATATIELDDGGYYYKTETVQIDENNNTVIIYLDDFTTLSGSVTAPVSAENAHVNVYQNDVLITSGLADASGNFSIPGVMPGTYQAVASLAGSYFEEQFYEVTATNQNIDFNLEEYPNDHVLHFAGDPTDKFQFLSDMSCGIRLAEDDIADYDGDAVAKVSFIAPFNPADGEIYAQIWKGNLLVSEKQVTDFTDGEWADATLEDFAVVDPDAEYYVGYRIHSLGGTIPAAWHDAGPMITGKGGYVRTTGWIPLPGAFDFNLCIKGTIITQTLGSDNNTANIFANDLGNNYPNPFNPTTTINYSLAEDSFVELEIYNVKGQLVKTLVANEQTAGQHSVEWNGKDNLEKDVSSGIYFYKMRAGGRYTSTRKMILLK